MSESPLILIADDEFNVRLMFRTALASAGYTVAEAKNGEEALMWLQAEPFDLVLLDLRMSPLGGMEVLECLRESGNEVPVIIVTAHGSVPDAVAALKLGAIDFLTKPLTPDALRTKVAEVLERHSRSGAESQGPGEEPITAARQFATNLAQAKRALNRRVFPEAEVFLRQALALNSHSAEAHNLMGVLHESRNEHDASYRAYRAALKADRHYRPAQQNMRRYYERFTFGKSDVPVDLGEA
jgi:DNA-binding response OmpR family regulator